MIPARRIIISTLIFVLLIIGISNILSASSINNLENSVYLPTVNKYLFLRVTQENGYGKYTVSWDPGHLIEYSRWVRVYESTSPDFSDQVQLSRPNKDDPFLVVHKFDVGTYYYRAEYTYPWREAFSQVVAVHVSDPFVPARFIITNEANCTLQLTVSGHGTRAVAHGSTAISNFVAPNTVVDYQFFSYEEPCPKNISGIVVGHPEIPVGKTLHYEINCVHEYDNVWRFLSRKIYDDR